MMRPYYRYDDDDRRREAYYRPSGGGYGFGAPVTPAVRWIVAVCAVIFVMEMLIGGPEGRRGEAIALRFGFVPALAVGHAWLWQFVTYMFLHASFWHIFFNLFFFWMIGGLAEQSLGTKRFLWLYGISGVAGAAGQALLAMFAHQYADVPTIGASGAIMGVTMAVAMLYPDITILLFFIIPIRMRYFPWVLVFFQLWGMSSEAGSSVNNVAYFAHLAGLGAGYLFVKWHRGFAYSVSRAYGHLKTSHGVQHKGVTHIDDDAKYREEVDRLLDKIFKDGPGSLSASEKDFLKKQSEKYRK